MKSYRRRLTHRPQSKWTLLIEKSDIFSGENRSDSVIN